VQSWCGANSLALWNNIGIRCLDELSDILWRQRFWQGSIYSLLCVVVPHSGPGVVGGYSLLLLLYYSLVTYCYFYHFHIYSASTVQVFPRSDSVLLCRVFFECSGFGLFLYLTYNFVVSFLVTDLVGTYVTLYVVFN